MPRDRVKPELQKFLEQIKAYEKNRFQTRVFVYLDIISWVESKVYNKPISAIIHQKYLDELQSRSQRKSSAAGLVVR